MARLIKRIKKLVQEKTAQRKAAKAKQTIVDAVLEPIALGAEAVEAKVATIMAVTPMEPPKEVVPPTPPPLAHYGEFSKDVLWGIKDMSGIILVKLSTLKVLSHVFSDWDTQIAHDFPSDIIVIDLIQDYTANVAYLHYWTPTKGLGVAFLDKRMKVEVLPATEGEEIRKAYKEYILTNLSQHIGYAFTVGSDPEIFVEDEKDVVIPAFKFLGGKKDKTTHTAPVPYGNLPLYWDGFQAEFETSAQSCLAWQVDSVQAGLKGLLMAARKVDPKAKLSTRTVMDIPPPMIQEAANEHVAFGCMPSLNAYGATGLQKDGRDVLFRPAGGHIHFGIGKTAEADAVPIVKALDAILGVACVSLFQKYDDPRRRQLYGLPGEYRLPPHGLEYRTLSNAWLIHPMIMNLVFDIGRKALVVGRRGLLPLWDATEAEVIECITKSDVKMAHAILNRNKALFYKILYACYGTSEPRADWIFKAILGGMDTVLATPSDVAANWDLDGVWHTHSDGIGKNVRLSESIVMKGNKVS